MELTKTQFDNRIKKVMEHNGYSEEMRTVKACEEKGYWTPVDLIIREWLNNGGGSSKGFLGLTRAECRDCYNYAARHKDELIEENLVSESATNNFGLHLWSNYGYDYAY